MKAYFDPSAMVTLLLQEQGWSELTGWVAGAWPVPHFSDFGWAEFVSAVARKTRQGEFDQLGAHALLVDVKEYLTSWKALHIQKRDIASGTELVSRFDLKLRAPDAIHIAVARRAGLVLVTRDQRQLIAAGTIGIEAIDPTAQTTGG